jgi:acyl carrier protein
MNDIAPQIIALIAKSKAVPVESLSLASTFDELHIDSLDKINLTFDVEEIYAIQIPDQALNDLRTIGDVVHGVESLLAEKQQAAEKGQNVEAPTA